jgi:hypothetical protein
MQSGLYFEFYVKDGKLKSRLKLSMYVYQLLSWLGIVFISKIILGTLQLLANSWLEVIGSTILYPLKDEPKLKLIVVMAFIPVILNTIQFWVQDNFLKHKKELYPQLEGDPKSNQMEYVLPDNCNDSPEKMENQFSLQEIDNNENKNEMQIDFEGNNEKNNYEINMDDINYEMNKNNKNIKNFDSEKNDNINNKAKIKIEQNVKKINELMKSNTSKINKV